MPISFEMNPYPTKKTSSPKGGQSWRPTKRFVSISIEIHALPYVMRILVASWEKILQLLLRDLTTYLFQFLPSLLFLLFLFRFFDVTANRKHSYEEIYWFQRDLWEFHNSISLLCVHYFAFVFSFFLNPKRIPSGELIMLLKSRFRSFTRISLVEWRAVLISRSFLIIGDSADSLATIQRKTEFTFR